ncbi:Lipid A export ATP-binding/permease protein MsbA [Clostridiaceae bacterium JG1575]|nr:Lipid A export ATP-binding/permease protein MsbA [Clostridiaceae bacterium JG1575]
MKSARAKGTFRRLLAYLLPHKALSLSILGLIAAVNLSALAKPLFIKVLADEFIVPGAFINGQGRSVAVLAFAYIGVMLFGMGAFYLQTLLITKLGMRIACRLREEVFSVILHMPLSRLNHFSAGRLITRTTNDVEAVSELFTDILVSLIKDGILVVGVLLAMVRLSPSLTGWAFLVLPPMTALVLWIRKQIHANWVVLKQITGRLNGFIAENVSGMKIVQLFNGQQAKWREFTRLNDDFYQHALVQMRMHSLSGPSANLFESLATVLILGMGLGAMKAGTADIGGLIALTLYIRQFFVPVADLAESFTQIESALVSADRIFELLEEKSQGERLRQGIALPILRGEIEFRHVSFAYEGEEYVLKDVSFHIHPGETFALVGQTGSGKTTIISLLCGFYPVNEGEILLDGIPIEALSKRDLRRKISVVLQDVFLFSGTLRENITLGDDIPPKVLEKALADSQARGLMDRNPLGFEAEVLEAGVGYSMGERQILSFARALAHDPAIFVLDEATANIDTKTEALIQKALEEASAHRTTLIIAHRLSTIRRADHILVLEQGSVVEEGSHLELMAQGGRYEAMVSGAGAH